jgi:hypothetical protein
VRPMHRLAVAADRIDRIDCWIRRRTTHLFCGTDLSQRGSKFSAGRHRQTGLSAIGRTLWDQYDALATPVPSHLLALVKQLETQK